MTGNGRNLVRRAAFLRYAPRCGIAQTVKSALRKPRRVQSIAEPVAEPRRREGPAECGR